MKTPVTAASAGRSGAAASAAPGAGAAPAPAPAMGARPWGWLGLLFLGQFASTGTNAATTPILPNLVIDQLGRDATTTGAVVFVGAAAAVVASPLVGAWSDRAGFGRLTIGTLALAGGGLLAGAAWLSLPALYTSRVVYYAAMTVGTSILTAWLVAIFPASQQTRALNLYGIAVWLGLAVGPQLGGAIYDHWGGRPVFLVTGLIQLGAAAAMLALPQRRLGGRVHPHTGHGATTATPAGTTAAPGSQPRRRLVAATKAVTAPGLVAAVAWAGEGLIMTFLGVHLAGAGVGRNGGPKPATTLTVFGITVIATRVVLSILGDRLPQRLAVGGALVTLALGLIVLAVAASFAVAAAGAALMGVGFAPLFPALTRWSARNLGPSGQLGAGLSIFGSFTTVGYAIGSLSTGVVIDWYGSRPAFLGMGLAQLAVGVGLLAWGARRRPHPTTE